MQNSTVSHQGSTGGHQSSTSSTSVYPPLALNISCRKHPTVWEGPANLVLLVHLVHMVVFPLGWKNLVLVNDVHEQSVVQNQESKLSKRTCGEQQLFRGLGLTIHLQGAKVGKNVNNKTKGVITCLL